MVKINIFTKEKKNNFILERNYYLGNSKGFIDNRILIVVRGK
ncbi:hypothetical protein CPC_1148 [Clostridium perfringens C str. JGS1495]|nr:hypothetical protein CPC_1148 [Clostridium perfringens C str. JGS1495]